MVASFEARLGVKLLLLTTWHVADRRRPNVSRMGAANPRRSRRCRKCRADAAQALKEGKLDACAWDATLPGKPIVDLAATPGIRIRLLDTGAAVAKMVAKYRPFYYVAPIPKGPYPGVDQDVLAAVGKTLFVTHERTGELPAYEITKAVLEHTPELTVGLPAAKEITPTSAVLGSSIPFHPGALRYFKERGITAPPT
jgi:uncharacterized protein